MVRGSAVPMAPNVQPALPPSLPKVGKIYVLGNSCHIHLGEVRGGQQRLWETITAGVDSASPILHVSRNLRVKKKPRRVKGQFSSQESFQEEISSLASWSCHPWQLPGHGTEWAGVWPGVYDSHPDQVCTRCVGGRRC